MKKVSVTLFAAVLTAALLLPLYALSAVADTTVSARHAALYEPVTDTFLYEKNGDDRAPMASTTKVMTALIVLEQANLDETVSIPPEACGIEGSSIYMKPGERMTVRDLLYALLLQSANDAAAALAITVSGSIEAFARQMNERASTLGLVNTHFVNPHGLDDPEHFTSAKDLARIAAASMEIPEFRDMVGIVKYTIPSGNDGSTRVLFNHNRLLRLYGDAVGIKTVAVIVFFDALLYLGAGCPVGNERERIADRSVINFPLVQTAPVRDAHVKIGRHIALDFKCGKCKSAVFRSRLIGIYPAVLKFYFAAVQPVNIRTGL